MNGRSGATETSETTFKRADGAFVRRTPVSRVLLAPRAAEPVRLAGGAALLWDALVTPRTPAELVAAVAHGDVRVPDDIAADVERTLEALAASGLVERA